MFEMLLSACLAAEPGVCVERRLPFPQAVSPAECEARAPARAEAWIAAHPALTLQGWSCDAPAADPGFTVEEVASGVYVHRGRHETAAPGNGGDLANVGFVVGEDAVAVIDAGGSRAVAERLHRAIRDVTDKPIRWLILTHMHPDHSLGAAVFREAGATVIGHAKLERALAARAEGYLEANSALIGAEGFAGTEVILPDEGVESTREIDLGGRALRLEAHPTAHTDNDLTALDVESGIWFTGDLVFAEHAPAVDGSLTGWIALLEELRGREAAHVAAGHGPALLPWPSGSDALLAYLTGIAEETRVEIRNGATMREAVSRVGERFRGDWLLFDDFNRRNATVAYQELEWE